MVYQSSINAINAELKELNLILSTTETRINKHLAQLSNSKEKWKELKLIDVAKKKRHSFTGGPFGSNLKAKDYTKTGVRIIQLQNIGDGEFLNDYAIFTSKEKADELFSCNIFPGDIILSKMGDPVARATIVPDFDERYVMASDGIRLEVDNAEFDTIFILEAINSFVFRKKAIRHSTGTTRQRIGLGDLRKLTLSAPSLDEQQKVAELIKAMDTEIDLLSKKLETVKNQKKGLLQQLLNK